MISLEIFYIKNIINRNNEIDLLIELFIILNHFAHSISPFSEANIILSFKNTYSPLLQYILDYRVIYI